ncbi:metallophosphoesterase [Actinopolymorpha rutila]|uniref:Calcineurin-like phosphoesterase domain-containing protein n=1 Tax=Actinopolymorpha rutila TaxID=446787 RepID=A0A852ZGU3_9ACTN|nr:hypothetical protein [Actinopolymorpha rutila]
MLRTVVVVFAAAGLATLPQAGWSATSGLGGIQPAGASDVGQSADLADPKPGAAPELSPVDGAFMAGTRTVAATPTVADEDVVSLTVDGRELDAKQTVGVSHLLFDVGSNSVDIAFGNYFTVNGHRIDQPQTWVSERADLAVPNEYLVTGENVVEVVVGTTVNATCDANYDDFVMSDFALELLGEAAGGDRNEFTYDFGDGDCGSQQGKLLRAELTFTVSGDPRRTTGLAAEWDSTSVGNGEHAITATTSAGGKVTHTVTVNNAPSGAPNVDPVDGTLTNGRQPVFASLPADGAGDVASLTVDGKAPPTRPTLGSGTATLSFNVGSNSIEDRSDNFLLVNGKRVDLGGDWVNTRVNAAIPARWLVPGDNVIKVVTGDINASCGVNRDDFTISNLQLALEGATITGHDIAGTYAMGDGNCGSNTVLLREAELHYTIDAPAVHVEKTLGSGDAILAFSVGSNSIDDAFLNTVRVNGMERLIGGDFVNERVDLPIPNEWLTPGMNTIDVVTGTAATGCNRDDFAISAISLTPARGTATGRMIKQTFSMGDGNCGSNANFLAEIDLNFFIDAPAAGLRADVETTELADGNHTISATSATGQAATRLLVTDNTAPVVAASTPEAGQRITSSVPLSVQVQDPSSIRSGPDVSLDGDSIQLGDLVGPGLSAGEHTLAVTASDSLGNKATREVVFTSAAIPDVPADISPESGATGQPRTVKLSAKVSEPDGGAVKATFSQAKILNASVGWQGQTDAVPTTLSVPGERNIGDTRALAPGDGATIDAPTAGGVSFQRFDIPIQGHVDAPVLRWEGVIDPERLARLWAWNTQTSTWDPFAGSRGALKGNTVLTATVTNRYIDVQRVHVMITGEDPFADDIDPGAGDRFKDPADYDFAIVHMSDSQFLSEGATLPEHSAAERAVWEKAYGDIPRWIRDNAGARKIAYVAQTGDIIENNLAQPTTPEKQQQVIREFELSSRLQKILDDTDVPNGVLAGNHDNWYGHETGPNATYNQYYGPARYAAASQHWKNGTYGGPWREGDNENHYDLFSAGGRDFVAVALSYGITKEEARWADSIFKRYPDRNGILMSHDYLNASIQRDGRTAQFADPDGSSLFKQIVQPNPNVFLILAGHVHGVGTNVKPQVGQVVGNGVVELMADYQSYSVTADRVGLTEIGGYNPTDRLNFGAAFMRLLQIDVDRSELKVSTYSPFLDDFGATEFDPGLRYDGHEDNMVLPIDLNSRTTTFKSDVVALYTPTELIGQTTAPSGDVATVTWTNLRPAAPYAWIVTARSTSGGITASRPSVFVTADANGGPGTWGPDAPLFPYFPAPSKTRPPER